LGLAAVEGLLNGESNVMAGIVNNQLTYTSFKLAITKSKPIDSELLRLAHIMNN
jgi:6-phosphofructokinase 1